VTAVPIRVELDAFSGRPNPAWALNDEQARQLLALLSALPIASLAVAPNGDLGYRGFKLTGVPGEPEVFVGRGRVIAAGPGKVRCRMDDPRAIEAFLLDTARGHLDGPLWQAVVSLIGS